MINLTHFEGEVVMVPFAWMQRDKIQTAQSVQWVYWLEFQPGTSQIEINSVTAIPL
jgi:hypothetical protein